ncbi:T9SS type A sorting domain-containing protein [Tamlana fucoidanivorans]|uniref:T9SS type A sorting domain-containing protein n=1 Tax=Allotamlana fucoidanivorans TaxID=2583814 RepID=A0A5C4SNT5_9FLAO|nr:T9SS type A sorting domain-containing protein [Tamlana fucoidanivorans]TNJ45845.1 T9SS type A sorting domain-containing protein [Tamlana fucoidanivorans]
MIKLIMSGSVHQEAITKLKILMRKKKYSYTILILYFILSSYASAQVTEIFVSEAGSDSNTGSVDSPLATIIGARDRARITGAKRIWIRGGRYNYDATCNLDSQDSGLKISGYNDELVIFDGSKFIDPEGFTDVVDPVLLGKLHASAASPGRIKSTVVTDNQIIALLTKSTAQISINDKMKTLARFPNLGYATFNNNTINTSGEVTWNASKTHLGDYSNPKGGAFRLLETSPDFSKWSAEAARTERVGVRGYFTAVWLKETNRVFSVASGSGEIKLVDGSRYGLASGGANSKIRRVFIYNMLCELDEPGEWYFDTDDNRLYVWFDEILDASTKIGVWAGPQLFQINNANDITIEKITIQNVGSGNNGDGAINVEGASDNIRVAGVRFRFIAEPITALNFWHDVSNSKVLSCDFYDIPNATRLYGGGNKPTKSSPPGNNSIENCHFTQVFSKDFYGKACGVNGKGNKFINNLVHNMNGQPITHSGFNHTFERNEIFNVGIEEGDGGAIYTGNAVWTYGNTLKHNFVHHLMSVPSLLGRAAFFSDDVDGGETIEENVFYKAGWETIKTNKGAGHDVLRNVVLESYTGIRSGTSISTYNTAMDYLTTNPVSNDKSNYIGRMLKDIGLSNWQTNLTVDNWNTKIDPDWFNLYPRFQNVMNAYITNKKFSDYRCYYTGNMFFGSKNVDIQKGDAASVSGSQSITLSLFEDPNSLSFKFKEPRPAYAPSIPFQNIGLYLDDYRCAVPNKNIYRRNIKLRFDGQDAHNPSASYNYNTINDRLYYNTGVMVYATIPCANILPEISEAIEYLFDLGTPSSVVFTDYTRVSDITTGINFGWVDSTGLESLDRGAEPGVNALNRDFVTSADAKVFEARVVDGNWKVVITLGDKEIARDNMQIKAEGVVQKTGINRDAKQFLNEVFDVDVIDGKLTLEFSDEGGTDPNWVVTRIKATRNGDALMIPENQGDLNLVQIYPNPAETSLYINLEGVFRNDKVDIDIIDNLGRIILSRKSMDYDRSIDVSNFSRGIYYIKLKLENQTTIKRFIKQ